MKTYYQSFVPAANTVYKNNLGAGHAMVTDDYGGACGTTASPYINNCGFDLAGEILTTVGTKICDFKRLRILIESHG